LLGRADTVLAVLITFQGFELIRRPNHEFAQISGTVQMFQLLVRPLLYLAM
jgi:hypothetical protein